MVVRSCILSGIIKIINLLHSGLGIGGSHILARSNYADNIGSDADYLLRFIRAATAFFPAYCGMEE